MKHVYQVRPRKDKRGVGLVFLLIGAFTTSTATAQVNVSDKPKALALYAPRPEYPYEARSKHMTGKGIAGLIVDPSSGYVLSAQMLKSTGYEILDNAALRAFQQWRFRPGTADKVKIPINFTMQGFREWARVKGHSLWLHNALYWSLPEYSREARDKGLTGKCVVVVKVDPATGYVISASMLKSTGYEVLDNAALRTLCRWRFRPRSITTLEIPIQFTPTGVFY